MYVIPVNRTDPEKRIILISKYSFRKTASILMIHLLTISTGCQFFVCPPFWPPSLLNNYIWPISNYSSRTSPLSASYLLITDAVFICSVFFLPTRKIQYFPLRDCQMMVAPIWYQNSLSAALFVVIWRHFVVIWCHTAVFLWRHLVKMKTKLSLLVYCLSFHCHDNFDESFQENFERC